jgi:hypothetical protein
MGDIIRGRILDKGYRLTTLKNGNKVVNYAVKCLGNYWNFVTFLNDGMDCPPYLKVDKEIEIEMDNAHRREERFQGKVYTKYTVDISHVKSVNNAPIGMDEAPEFNPEEYDEGIGSDFPKCDKWTTKMAKLDEVLNKVKDMSPEFQQAFAKEIPRILGE